jgi:hypothetical protein
VDRSGQRPVQYRSGKVRFLRRSSLTLNLYVEVRAGACELTELPTLWSTASLSPRSRVKHNRLIRYSSMDSVGDELREGAIILFVGVL